MSPRALPSRDNPFATPRALANRNSSAFQDGSLIRADGAAPSALAEFVHDSFRALVLNPKFSCVAAKSAVRSGNYRFGHYRALGAPGSIEGLAHDLFSFVAEQDAFEGFRTFVASFGEPAVMDELGFEQHVWTTLRRLHRLDHRHHPWDASVSSDPESPEFSFSFAGRAFFVVGLHPGSSRFTRRFAFPTLVFNTHEQFEELRAAGKFHRMQDVIRARELTLQGDLNQNLASYGEQSEARQYSGRPVEEGWRCPFHRATTDTSDMPLESTRHP